MNKAIKIAGAIAAILAIIALGLCLLVDGVTELTTTKNQSRQVQAQCQSLGGVYDGETCWYAGKKTSIDDLMERLYGKTDRAD